jgi:GTP-binding protein Era
MAAYRDERFFASEIIRETLFFTLNEEIPYSCEVRIDSFKDRSPKLSAIEATIVVSK